MQKFQTIPFRSFLLFSGFPVTLICLPPSVQLRFNFIFRTLFCTIKSQIFYISFYLYPFFLFSYLFSSQMTTMMMTMLLLLMMMMFLYVFNICIFYLCPVFYIFHFVPACSAHNTQVYQVTRSGHEHCDVTEGILLDITPLIVDGRKLVTLYDKDLTEGVNLLIGEYRQKYIDTHTYSKTLTHIQKMCLLTEHVYMKKIMQSLECENKSTQSFFQEIKPQEIEQLKLCVFHRI